MIWPSISYNKISWLPYSTYLYLDFHLLSRWWLLHTEGSKMFEHLFHAGVSVFDHLFCKIFMSLEWLRVTPFLTISIELSANQLFYGGYTLSCLCLKSIPQDPFCLVASHKTRRDWLLFLPCSSSVNLSFFWSTSQGKTFLLGIKVEFEVISLMLAV